MALLASPRRLRQLGLLGMNGRNGDYIARYNRRRQYPLVDDKRRTKELAQRAQMAVPPLYGVVETEHQARRLGALLAQHQDFVIKPAHGSGGDGILVIVGRRNEAFVRGDGSLLRLEDLRFHVSNILSGMYSLGGLPDQAMIEYRVNFDPVFDPVSYRGVPDVRILVFLGVPAMAMIRLPTRASDGRANLHQGAIGVGIDIAGGMTRMGVLQNLPAQEHPDTGHSIVGLTIPQWPKLLELAARCHDLVGLGYLGVDLVLDRDHGPLILELNARPGLNIQLANRAGLRHRLARIEQLESIPAAAGERVALARRLFAGAVPAVEAG